MKRIISIIAVIAVILSCFVLAACSGKADESETKPAGSDNTSGSESNDTENIDTEKYDNSVRDETNPIAAITMENGDVITVELYYDVAPNTVKNFISLASSGFYDGLTFHRVIPGFMIQGGDPAGNGTGGPGYRIPGEFSDNDFNNEISHERGVISMARQGSQINPAAYYDTAGSQFFICVSDSVFLDGSYASFGKVIDGIEACDTVVSVETDSNNKPLEDVVIKTITVDTHGVTYDEPVTIAGN